jgi:hypothetical protein
MLLTPLQVIEAKTCCLNIVCNRLSRGDLGLKLKGSILFVKNRYDFATSEVDGVVDMMPEDILICEDLLKE